MTPGEKLDRFLGDSIGELKGKDMPETGAKQSISSLREAMAGVKRAADEAALAIVQQADRMKRNIENNGALVVRKLQQEEHETMEVFGEYLGNERAEDQG